MSVATERAYADVTTRIERCRHPVDVLGIRDEHPLLACRVGTSEPQILLIAGTHGDEPAAVEAALQALERPGEWDRGLGVDVLPCTNPTGFEANTRETVQGVDINWSFDRTDVPEIELLKSWLAGRRYRAVIDFHEDWETGGFYLYEHRLGVAAAGPRMIDAVAATGLSINRDSEIEGWPARDGVVTADSSKERMERGNGFPLVLLRDHAPHKLTTETPTELPLQTRVNAHHAALDALLTHYAEAL